MQAVGPDQQPKYLNTSETPVFHKGRNLFAADIARAHATKAGEVLLAEGADPQELLRRLVERGAVVSKFERVEPSLHDIFIAEVGGAR